VHESNRQDSKGFVCMSSRYNDDGDEKLLLGTTSFGFGFGSKQQSKTFRYEKNA